MDEPTIRKSLSLPQYSSSKKRGRGIYGWCSRRATSTKLWSIHGVSYLPQILRTCPAIASYADSERSFSRRISALGCIWQILSTCSRKGLSQSLRFVTAIIFLYSAAPAFSFLAPFFSLQIDIIVHDRLKIMLQKGLIYFIHRSSV